MTTDRAKRYAANRPEKPYLARLLGLQPGPRPSIWVSPAMLPGPGPFKRRNAAWRARKRWRREHRAA